MRVLLAASALLVPIAVSAARAPSLSMTCAQRSMGQFERGFDRRISIVRGPFAFAGLKRAAETDAGELRRMGWWKSPAVVLPGHRVKVAIARRARRRAGLIFSNRDGRGVDVSDAVVIFKSCPKGQTGDSTNDGRQVTFWAGGLTAASYPACVPIEIWIDRARKPRRVNVELGAGGCASAAVRRKELGCNDRSEGGFIDGRKRNKALVAGPISFAFLRQAEKASLDNLNRFDGVKTPALLLPGHTVRVAVTRRSDGWPRFGSRARTESITFTSCRKGQRHDSNTDGRQVTFWSGGFSAKSYPACVRLRIWIDRARTARRVDVPLGARGCG